MLAIINSIKRRQQLFKTHFLSKDFKKVKFYKKYNNKLKRVKDVAKKRYFQEQFKLNRENLKTTWKLIGMIVNYKRNCGHPRITKLIHKNRCYTEKADIAHQLNTHFTNVGRELEVKLPTSNENANQYIKRSFRDSFTFRSILVHEVHDLIMGINLNKSTIGVPKECIEFASDHISECLTFIFNQSLQQGIVPDILKLQIIVLYQLYQLLHKYLKNVSITSL